MGAKMSSRTDYFPGPLSDWCSAQGEMESAQPRYGGPQSDVARHGARTRIARTMCMLLPLALRAVAATAQVTLVDSRLDPPVNSYVACGTGTGGNVSPTWWTQHLTYTVHNDNNFEVVGGWVLTLDQTTHDLSVLVSANSSGTFSSDYNTACDYWVPRGARWSLQPGSWRMSDAAKAQQDKEAQAKNQALAREADRLYNLVLQGQRSAADALQELDAFDHASAGNWDSYRQGQASRFQAAEQQWKQSQEQGRQQQAPQQAQQQQPQKQQAYQDQVSQLQQQQQAAADAARQKAIAEFKQKQATEQAKGVAAYNRAMQGQQATNDVLAENARRMQETDQRVAENERELQGPRAALADKAARQSRPQESFGAAVTTKVALVDPFAPPSAGGGALPKSIASNDGSAGASAVSGRAALPSTDFRPGPVLLADRKAIIGDGASPAAAERLESVAGSLVLARGAALLLDKYFCGADWAADAADVTGIATAALGGTPVPGDEPFDFFFPPVYAVVDAQAVVTDSAPGKAAIARLQRKQEELEAKVKLGSISATDAQLQTEALQRTELAALEQAARQVFEDVGRKMRLAVVFNKFQSSLVYTNNDLDITRLVIKRLNDQAGGNLPGEISGTVVPALPTAWIDVDRLLKTAPLALRMGIADLTDADRQSEKWRGIVSEFEKAVLPAIAQVARAHAVGLIFSYRSAAAILAKDDRADLTGEVAKVLQ